MKIFQTPVFLALYAISLGGCTGHGEDHVDTGHGEVEVTVAGDQLASAFAREGDFLVSPVASTREGFNRVSALVELHDERAEPVRIELETGDTPGVWLPLETLWSEAPLWVMARDLEAEELEVRLRIAVVDVPRVYNLTWSRVYVDPSEMVSEEPEVGSSSSALSSELASAGVIPRSAWGARPGRCSTDRVKRTRVTIHHTAGQSRGDPALLLRGVQSYHMLGNRWCDVAYHFFVSRDGRVWEGRPAAQLGTHVYRNNSGNLGVSFMGCFHDAPDCPGGRAEQVPQVMLNAAGSFLCKLRTAYELGQPSSVIRPHSSFPSSATACPGGALASRIGELQEMADCEANAVCEDRWGPCSGSGERFDRECCGDLICEAGTCVRHRMRAADVPTRSGPSHYQRIGASCDARSFEGGFHCAESLLCKAVGDAHADPTCCAPVDRRCNGDGECCGAMACEDGKCRARSRGDYCIFAGDCEGGATCRATDGTTCGPQDRSCVCGGQGVRG